MARPKEGEYGAFYQGYIDQVTGEDVLSALQESLLPLEAFLKSLENTDLSYSYALGKWTIGQLLQHMIDTERIFAYRALCIGRGEKQPLPGFDENTYADEAPATKRKLKGMTKEMLTLRKSSIILFRSLKKEKVISRKGTASEKTISVNAIGFIMVGHVLHHINILNERYLNRSAI